MEQEIPGAVKTVILAAAFAMVVGALWAFLEFALLKRFTPIVFRLGWPLLRARYPWPDHQRFEPGEPFSTDRTTFRFVAPDAGYFRSRIEQRRRRGRNRESMAGLAKGTLRLEPGAVRVDVRYSAVPLLFLGIMATIMTTAALFGFDLSTGVRALLLVAILGFVFLAMRHSLRTELRVARTMIDDLRGLYPALDRDPRRD